jgi:hypothetical protein
MVVGGMNRERLPLVLGGALFLFFIALFAAGVWWYLFGPNEVDSAELVPGNTLAFAEIPNGASIVEALQTSQLKKLLDSPNAKPLHDYLVSMVGQKNVDLFHSFLPNLSGQSFIAVTHFEYDKPEQVGLIAAMKPKSGLGDFETFLDKIKAAWPDVVKQGKTGHATVEDVDYEWIQGPGAADRICVAQLKGWIVTTWGEAALQDWIERFEKKSTTSSLAEDVSYRTSLSRVGDDPMTLVYVNYHALIGILQKQMAKTNPALGDFIARKLDALGGGALATRFENGEIVDRFSFLIPRPAQLESGMGVDPCPFDTLKFTGPDTHFYWATSANWNQYYENIKEQSGANTDDAATAPANPMANNLTTLAQNWVHSVHLDPHHNIIDALGPEVSLQVDWSQDTTWPEVGLFVKVDKPDDFKPTIDAIVESVRQTYIASAVIREVTSNGHHFATLKFVQPGIFTPTITEDGPYLGIFLTENQAVRSFSRTDTTGLLHNDDFNRQMGNARTGASQIAFLDSPYLLNRAYQTAMPYVSLLSMFNKDVAAQLKGRTLPPDLTWLAPVGTWSCAITPDGAGIQGYSVSGMGNQGIFLAAALAGANTFVPSLGFFSKPKPPAPVPPVTTAATPPDTTAPLTTGTVSATPTTTNANATAPAPPPPASITNSIPDALQPPPEPNQPPPAH